MKPIWTRPSGEVEDEEYHKFYKEISKAAEDPAARTHFSAEGEIGFKAMLFIPTKAPRDLCPTSHKKNLTFYRYSNTHALPHVFVVQARSHDVPPMK